MSRSRTAIKPTKVYTITLQDSTIKFDNVNDVFPYFNTLDTYETTLNTNKKYFDRAVVFANWYNSLSVADRKHAVELSTLTDDLIKTSSRKSLNKWMTEYTRFYTNPEDIAAFCELASTLNNDCLFNIMCRMFVTEFQSMSLSNFCSKYGFSNDFTTEELTILETEKNAFQNLFDQTK